MDISIIYNTFIPQLASSNRNFHIQQPGVKVVDGKLMMNKVMQGGDILYCLDDGNWLTYTSPVELPATTQIVKAKIRYLGKESNTTWLWIGSQTEIDGNIQEQNTGATF